MPEVESTSEVAHQEHAVKLLERVQLEGTGADRLLPHLLARHVVGIDRRESLNQQHPQLMLQMVDMDGDFEDVGAVHEADVALPAAARIVLELVARPAGHQVESAFDVRGGERPADLPFHAAAQLEGELGLVLVPAP